MIKFRVWLKDVCLMTEVNSIDFKNNTVTCEHWEYGVAEPSTMDEVILMRYTGLKDSKGNEIYEGDIVQVKNYPNDRMRIIFEDGCFWTNYDPLWKVNVDLEVLGNIYENPELL